MTDLSVTTRAIEFVAPLMGFAEQTTFHLLPLDEEGTLSSLRAADGSGVRLVVVAPGRFFPDYAPRVDDEVVHALDLQDASEAVVLNVVNIGDDPATATVNLLAPIVVNQRTLRAAQVVLAGTELPLRAPLLVA
ncbi:flagellar assembly protein FliW [Kineococcus aurantiacus]|uniref:Flagellar assembly factor FliW n=1 Tax=Kineococcus aurantiacus TaxID=37633 RepID=A0A7Y9DQB0_9ACTN|nr:flagellar assembly protein FliW [Kineococcus aurantiacus]NYD24571.1 flagellar assembly factor FliW [Kineococcus aurantiacus]